LAVAHFRLAPTSSASISVTDGAVGWPNVESEGVDAIWVVVYAAAAEQLEHVLLSWLAKGESVERDVVLEPARACLPWGCHRHFTPKASVGIGAGAGR
jgi:hypothetical protein